MLSRIQTVQPPSTIDVQKMLREQAPTLRLYSPKADWVPFEVHAVEFFIPPDLGGRRIPHITEDRLIEADGTLVVGTKYGTGPNSPVVAEASDIVKVAIRNYEHAGVTFLPGDGRDEALRLQAKNVHNKYRKDGAEAIVNRWGEKVTAWLAKPANKGKTPPSPPSGVLSAMEFLDDLVKDETPMAYQCPHCWYPTDDFEKYAKHMRVQHNERVGQAVNAKLPVDVEVTDELEEVPNKKAGKKKD